MNKKLALVAVVALIVFGTIWTLRVCRQTEPGPEYWVLRAEYEQLVAESEAAHDEAVELIYEYDIERQTAIWRAELEKAAREQLETQLAKQRINELELEAENARLKTEAQPAIDANPEIRELVRNYDLRMFNKDTQITNLALQRDRAVAEASANFEAYQTAAAQSLIWREQYEKEHALRLAGDALRLGLERRYKTSKTWEAIGKWGPPAAFCIGLLLGK